MGNTLNAPITEKSTQRDDRTHKLRWGVSSMQGWRTSMEDAHIAEPIVLGEETALPEHYLFAVLDGHGGSFSAKFASAHLLPILCAQPTFQQYVRLLQKGQQQNKKKRSKKLKTNSHRSSKRSDNQNELLISLLTKALEDAFVETDCRILKAMVDRGVYQLPKEGKEKASSKSTAAEDLEGVKNEKGMKSSESTSNETVSGTTAAAVIVTPDWIVCANAGDSRAVLDDNALSRDHQPDLDDEKTRIEAANGTVYFGRVDGELAVSRALGDYEFKDYRSTALEGIGEQDEDNDELRDERRRVAQRLKVSPVPEVLVRPRSDENKVLVVACDGIWDVLSNSECFKLVRDLFEEGESDVGLVAEEILDNCLKKGSRDNMTVIVVQFEAQTVGQGGGVAKRRKQRQAT